MNSPLLPQAFAPDWSRSFLCDQAYAFLSVELANGETTPGRRDNLLLERCTAYLMAVANCSRRTAETHAAQVIAELASCRSAITFDMHRSTPHALFVVDRASGQTRVLSAIELAHLINSQDAATLAN